MSKSTRSNRRNPRTPARLHATSTPAASLPLRKTWPISLCVGLVVGSIVFSSDALAGGPTGGVVVGGSGTITHNGNSTVINQASNRLALNWQTFNVGANESVLFNQPGRSAVALNRILDQNPSQIFGKINSNGQVFLINTHGIIFGATAQMNVGGLMASTLDLTPKDFLAGNYSLNAVSGSAGIVNHGLIQAASGGSVALVGGSVLNDGLILANYGSINLDGADHAVLDFDGNGLINIQITGELKKRLDAKEAAVSNKGALKAEQGTVVLQASAAKDLFTNLVNNSGVIDASGISTDGGVVRLVGNGGNTLNSGSIDVSGVRGGKIRLLSDKDVLVTGGVLDASGVHGGGEVLVGGDAHGANPLVQNAQRTYLGSSALIKADATEAGDGGKIIVWSDNDTRASGGISARGGNALGDGGFVEVSGKKHLDFAASVDTSAFNGATGTLLLDPDEITITHGTAAATDASIVCTDGDCGTPGAGPFGDTTATSGSLTDGTLNAQLAINNVTVTTSTNGITSNSNVSVDLQNNTLNLDSATSITLGGTFNGAGNLNLNFTTTLDLASSVPTFTASPTVAATGDGTSTIKASGETWNITGANQGNLSGLGVGFSGVANLSDTTSGNFVFVDGAGLGGTVAGGSNAGMLDYSALTTGVSVGLSGAHAGTATGTGGFSGIAAIKGGAATDTVTGLSTADTFTLSGANAFSSSSIDFSAFDTILGGGGSDTIGGTGQTYTLTDGIADAGASDGVGWTAVKNISDATGTIDFGTAGSVTGNVTAQTLDYGSYLQDLTLDVDTGAITGGGVGGTLSGYDTVDANAAQSNTITGTGATYALGAAPNQGSSGGYSWSGFQNISDATGTVDFGTAGSVAGNVTAQTLDYASYSAPVSFDLSAGTGTTSGIDGTWSGVTTVTGSAGSDTIIGSGRTYTLDNTTANTGSDSTVGWSGFENISDATGTIDFGTAGSVTGDITAQTLNYASYGTPVTFDLSAGTGTTSGMGGTWSGVTTVTGSAGNDTISGNGEIYHLSGANAGDNGAVTWSSFENVADAGVGTLLAANQTWSLTGHNQGTVTDLAGNFSGIGNLTDSGAGTFSMHSGADGDISGNLDAGSGGSIDYTGYATPVDVNLSGSGTTGIGGTTSGISAVTASTNLGVSGNTGGALTIATTGVGTTTILGAISVGADLNITASGSVSQTGGALDVTGASTIDVADGAITLNGGSNHFGGAVSLDNSGANDVSLDNGSNALILGSSTVGSGALSLKAIGITQTGAIQQAPGGGAVTLDAGAGDLKLITVTNDFTGDVTASGKAVQITDANDLVVAGLTSAADNSVSLVAGADLTLAPTITNIDTGTADLTLSAGTSLSTQGKLSGQQVSLIGASGVTLNDDVQAGGTLTLTSTAGDIRQTAGTILAAVGTNISGGGAVDLTGVGNDFQGTVTAAGSSVALTDLSALEVNLTAGDVTLTAGAGLTVSGTVHDLTTSAGATSFGATTASGNLSATATGPVSQTGALVVTGTSTIAAGSNAITLTNGGNHFTGAVSLGNSGNNAVALDNGSNPLILGNVGVGTGTLTVTGTGITQSGATAITQEAGANAATFDAGAGNTLTLANASNDFTGAVSLTGGATQITDVGALTLGTLNTGALTATSHGTLNLGAGTVGGHLSAASNGGAIIQSGALSVTGGSTSDIDAGAGAITLTQANDFTGVVKLTGTTTQITDANALALGVLSTGALTAVSTGTLNLGSGTVGGALSATSNGGAIGQTGAMTVTGSSMINAGSGALALSQANNDFQGAVTATGAGVSLVDVNDLSVTALTDSANGNVSLISGGTLTLPTSAVAAGTGNLTLASNGGALSTSGALSGTKVSLTGHDGVTLGGDVSALGTLALTSTNAAIAQTGGSITAVGASTVAAGTGAVTLDAVGNDFIGTVDLVGDTTRITDQNALTLGTLATGALTAISSGALNLGSGNVSGNLVATSNNGAISQAGLLKVTGTSLINAGTGAITLTHASNDFQGSVSATGTGVSITDVNNLAIATLNDGANGTVSLIAGGLLTLPTGSINTGSANLTLTSNGGSLTTPGALSGANISLTGHGLALNNNVTTAGTLGLFSGAAIGQGAGIITAGSLTGSSVGSTTLGSANKIGTLGNFSAANFSLNNAQALVVNGPLTTTGNTGDISLKTTSGDLIVHADLAGGTVALTSAGNLALTKNLKGTTVALASGGNLSQTAGVITAGLLSGNVAGSTALDQANKIAALGAFSSGNGLSVTNSRALTVSGPVSGGASTTLTTTAGALAINGAVSGTTTKLESAAAISEGSGGSITASTLSGQSAGATVLNGNNHIGTLGKFSAASFGLTNAQALTVSGPISGGSAVALTTTAGNLVLNGAISGTATTLKSAGTISEGAGGSIAASTLSGQSSGATRLSGTNHIGTLGRFSAADFGLTNAQALTIGGPVNGGTSVTLTTTAGDLTINGQLDGATTTLQSAGTIVEGAGGSITANLLTGHAVGNTTLDGNNRIDTLGNFSADFSLTNAQTLTVTGPLDGGPVVNLTTTAGDLLINGAINGATTTLKSAGAIREGAGGSITASTLSGQSAGATTLTGNNHIGTLASFSAASLELTNAQALTVSGAISGGAGTTLTTTAGDLTIDGAVSGASTALNSAGAITEGVGGSITAGTLSGHAMGGATALGSAAHPIRNMVDTLGNFSSPAGFSMTNDQTLTLASVGGSAFTVDAGTSAFYLSVTHGDLFQLGTAPVYNSTGVWSSTGRMGTGSAPIYVVGTGPQTIAMVGLAPAYFYAIDSTGSLLPLGGGLAINVPTASGAGSAQNGNHGDSYIDPGVITANYRSYGIVPSGVRLPEDQQSGCDPDQPDQLDCEDVDSVGMVNMRGMMGARMSARP